MLTFASLLDQGPLSNPAMNRAFLAEAFGFAHISLAEYGVALAMAFSVIPIVELVKLVRRRFSRQG